MSGVASLHIDTFEACYNIIGKYPEAWTPKTRETADHSLPYITARAMLDGAITNDSYSAAKLHDPALRAFIDRITVAEDPALTARQPEAVPNRITATLTDGRQIVRQVDDVPGFVARPMTHADVERKFRMNAGQRLDETRIRTALDAFWSIDERGDVTGMLALLA